MTIISSAKSDGKSTKRWNILSYHRVREAITHDIVKPFRIDGKENPADVLSKHTSSSVWCELMRPLIFWRNNDIDNIPKIRNELLAKQRVVLTSLLHELMIPTVRELEMDHSKFLSY